MAHDTIRSMLANVQFPASKSDIVAACQADSEAMTLVEQLPDQEFNSVEEVMGALPQHEAMGETAGDMSGDMAGGDSMQ